MDPVYPATGFVVGILIGLTGMGGGALMTPFLILVLGTTPVVAVGTDLVYGAATKIVGGFLHLRHGTVDLRLVGRLAVGSVPGGIAAVVALRMMPEAGLDVDLVVRRSLGAVLILVASTLLLRAAGIRPPRVPPHWRQMLQGRGTIAVGAGVGVLVGLTSVGSGSLLVPFLLFAFSLKPAQVVGTDVFHAAILVTVTAIGHAQAGSVDWVIAAGLLAGSIPGVALGSWLVPRMPAARLRIGIAVLLLLTGIGLV